MASLKKPCFVLIPCVAYHGRMHSAERRDDEGRPGEGLERKQPRPTEGEDQPGGAVDSRRSPRGESLYIRRFDWLAAGLVGRLMAQIDFPGQVLRGISCPPPPPKLRCLRSMNNPYIFT